MSGRGVAQSGHELAVDTGAPGQHRASCQGDLADLGRRHAGSQQRARHQADAQPGQDGGGRLLVKGFFPTEPPRVNFDLDFIPSDAEWKLIRINVKIGSPP